MMKGNRRKGTKTKKKEKKKEKKRRKKKERKVIILDALSLSGEESCKNCLRVRFPTGVVMGGLVDLFISENE